MMSLFEAIEDKDGTVFPLAGILPGKAVMQSHLAALGTQFAELPEGRLSGHTFHHSRSETPLPVLALAKTANGGAGEVIYRFLRSTVSYMHFYFPSNPAATAGLFLN